MELPVTVDVAAYLDLFVAGLGAVVGVVCGGYCAFELIRMALRWALTVDGSGSGFNGPDQEPEPLTYVGRDGKTRTIREDDIPF